MMASAARTTAASASARTATAQRIRGTGIRQHFAFCAENHGLGAAETGRFDKSNKISDSAIHGDEVDVTFEVAGSAEHLLRANLMSDFDLEREVAWEGHSVIHG